MRKSYIFGWMLMLSGLAHGQGTDVTICQGTSLRLNAESPGANKFEWYRNNELIAGAVSSTIMVSEAGIYRAIAIIGDGCKSDASISVSVQFRVPVATDDLFIGAAATEKALNLLQNDVALCSPLDPGSIVIKRTAAHGILERNGDEFIYRPDPGFKAIDTFTYTVRDGHGNESNEAEVKLDVSAPLPVRIISFSAKKEESVTLVTWVTSSETNSNRFDIERSTDGKTWYKIGEVKAAGESEEARNYHFVDSLPESGINYYRLKSIDHDDSFAYSRIESVHFPEFTWAQVFPNPVNDLLHVVIRNKNVVRLRLSNISGQVLLSSPVSDKSLQLDMKPYGKGIYFIHLEQKDGKTGIFKIMRD